MHAHIDSDICMEAKNNECLVEVRQVLEILIEVRHRSRHNDRNHKVGNAVLINRERNDLIWMVCHYQSVKPSGYNAHDIKHSGDVCYRAPLYNTAVVLEEDEVESYDHCYCSDPADREKFVHYVEFFGDLLELEG
jgi:hypothetical protein